jgi:hypothetical protein
MTQQNIKSAVSGLIEVCPLVWVLLHAGKWTELVSGSRIIVLKIT